MNLKHVCIFIIFSDKVHSLKQIFKGITASKKVQNRRSQRMNESHILEGIYEYFLTKELLMRIGQEIVQVCIL